MLRRGVYIFLCFIVSFHCIKAQSLYEQLATIDRINNDSVAYVRLRTLSEQSEVDTKSKLEINYRIVSRANSLQEFGEAVRISNESIIIADKKGLDSLEAYFTKLLGISYYYMDQKRAAIPYFEKAAVMANKNGFWELEASCYNNIGGSLADVQEYEKAEPYLLKSIRIMKANGAEEKPATLQSYRVLARLYDLIGQSEKAEQLYVILIGKARFIKDSVLLSTSLVFYSNLLTVRGDYEKAVKMGEEALTVIDRKDGHMMQMALTMQGQNLAFVGRYKEAYNLLEQANYLVRSNFKKDLDKEVSNMEVFYRTEKIKQDKERTEEQAKKQLLIYVLSIVGILLLLTFGIYIWNQRKNNHQKNILQQQKLETLIEGEEKERMRVARDLHDGIVQDLTAVKLKLQKETQLSNQDELLTELDQAIFEVRNIAYQMMPVALKEYGLVSSLDDLVRKMMSLSNIGYEFEAIDTNSEEGILEPTTRFSEKVEICLYRVAQELLNNVVKHSNATLVSLTLSKHPDKLTLFCEDNGRGFDETTIQKGIGMNGLITRLALLNGTISFQRSGESGTMVMASVPLA